MTKQNLNGRLGQIVDELVRRGVPLDQARREFEKQWSTPVAGTEELAMTAVESESVRSALMRLPEEQRTAVAMAFFGGYSYREVADRLGVPEGTIKSRIRLALRRLQGVLEAQAA